MKIICIGRNYIAHAKELNNPVPDVPIFFLKPDSSILKNNKPFFLPDFSQEIHYELEIVVKIDRLGKSIPARFASRYFSEIGVGIDFTARDLQRECTQNGLPWEISKSFDGSAALGKFIEKKKFENIQNLSFKLEVNGRIVQKGNTADMVFPVDELISYLSRFFTLKTGDLIFTGTPEGVGPVKRGDHLKAYIEDELLLDFYVK
ncbi:MAG: fumarylacetoacetate hydrolase family protein [Bacteroidales bacterium]|nr:MAG: fumarylacetoacetate hydrolase family protein [Bacteroidales bacterium]